jgi:hypothetical protein
VPRSDFSLRQGRVGEALALLEPAAARYPQDLTVQGALARTLIAHLSELDVDFKARQATLNTAKDALTPGTVECGRLPSPVRVLVTYRPSETATSNTSTLGDLVAVELLPDDYTPRPTPGEGGAIQP